MRGKRIKLTTDIESLSVKAHTGDQGTVHESHAGGHLTVRMDNGHIQFPTTSEVTVINPTILRNGDDDEQNETRIPLDDV